MAEQVPTYLSLFNLPAFSALPGDGRQYERIDVELEGRFVGSLAGVVQGDVLFSGFGASFGGLDFARERETLENVSRVVDAIVDRARAMGISRVQIRAKPFHYSKNEEYCYFALCRRGFTVAELNLNFYLDLERFGDSEGYYSTLRHAPVRQLKRALTAELQWGEASGSEEWAFGYDVLVDNRRRHDASLSLSLDHVLRMREVFGDRVRMFLLHSGDDCIAAVLLYTITPRHGMVMYWGDRPGGKARDADGQSQLAVMNLVAFRTIEAALSAGFQSLDLGPVSTNERVNLGNARFKASINALPEFRHTLTLDL